MYIIKSSGYHFIINSADNLNESKSKVRSRLSASGKVTKGITPIIRWELSPRMNENHRHPALGAFTLVNVGLAPVFPTLVALVRKKNGAFRFCVYLFYLDESKELPC